MTTKEVRPRQAPTALSRRVVVKLGLGAGLGGAFAAFAVGWHPASGQGTGTEGAATPAGSPAACVASPAASPSASSPAASPAASATIHMTNQLRFDPGVVTIHVGQTVTWVNAGTIPHTSTDDPAKNPVEQAFPQYALLPPGAAPWDSGLLPPGQSFSHTFTVPGTYHYFCIPHILSGMRGTIVVVC